MRPTNPSSELADACRPGIGTGKRGEILTTDRDLVPTGYPADHQLSNQHALSLQPLEPGSLQPLDPGPLEPLEPGGDAVDWQTAMRRAIRSPVELLTRLGLDPVDRLDRTEHAPQRTADRVHEFPMFVPLEFLSRMRPGDPDDPLLRQVLASPEEWADAAGFVSDPVGDLDVLDGGALFKYHGRALLISTGTCGVHCRYCFRREFPYREAGTRSENWRPAIEAIRRRSEIEEVLLSGGDPLTLVDESLASLVDAITAIGHVRRLRIHTRMPVVIPQRVTPRLIEILTQTRLTVWFVIHANHPNELDASVLQAVGRLIDRGIPVLNQAVLLRGVNDDAATLVELCRLLVDHRIGPYYLHQLDHVRGAAHFEVSQAEGRRLMQLLREQLPGYAVPQYVQERPGEASKTPLGNATPLGKLNPHAGSQPPATATPPANG